MQEHAIRFENINMSFQAKRKEVTALLDISLEIGRHTFTSIVGPSGCGKSTLLSLCAGLKFPSSGRTYCDGRAVEAVNTDIGFVTQDSNLFPWMTLRENVEFPLRVRGLSARDRRDRAQSQIDMVGLSGFEDHYPHQLSGGMQKRASIIRTLVYEPDVILMDEPFGALDAQTKLILQDELLRMWSTRKQTILFVTHDLTEAVALSDQVVVMTGRPGRIKGVFDVNLQRPRDVFQIHIQEGFADNYQQVWDCFRAELIEAEGPAAATEISA
jgi:NitT/TauT family transport system ATP-binding protein